MIVRADLPRGRQAAQILNQRINQRSVWSALVRTVSKEADCPVAVQAEDLKSLREVISLKPDVNTAHTAAALFDFGSVLLTTAIDVVNREELVFSFSAAGTPRVATAVVAHNIEFRVDVATLILLLFARPTARLQHTLPIRSGKWGEECLCVLIAPLTLSTNLCLIRLTLAPPPSKLLLNFLQARLEFVLKVRRRLTGNDRCQARSGNTDSLSSLCPSQPIKKMVRNSEKLLIRREGSSTHG